METKTIIHDRRKIAYCIFGDASLKNPVFYFHGFPGSRLEIEFFHEEALAHGLSIIAFDRPGLGKSEYHSSRTIASVPSIVQAIADSLTIKKFSLLGVSGGTPYALATAALRASSVTFCLIISGVGPFHMPALMKKMSHGDRFLLKLVKNFPKLSSPFIHGVWKSWRQSPERMFKIFVRSLHLSDKKILLEPSLREKFMGNILEALSDSSNGIRKELELLVAPWKIPLEQIQCETVFIHGKEDVFVPHIMSVENSRLIKGSRAELLESGGHFVILLLAKDICQRIASHPSITEAMRS